MMKKEFILPVLIIHMVLSCTSSPDKTSNTANAVNTSKDTGHLKPPASFYDTLRIDQKAAVFFYPDSLQLKRIAELTEKGMHEAMMHEYEYQVRNSKKVLNKYWPGVKIIDARNCRYLLFKINNNLSISIDLNSRDDSHGLYLFDGRNEPRYADMMNIDTELHRYFSN